MAAASFGHTAVIVALIYAGADVTATDSEGYPAGVPLRRSGSLTNVRP
jgi:hypothetical protein